MNTEEQLTLVNRMCVYVGPVDESGAGINVFNDHLIQIEGG